MFTYCNNGSGSRMGRRPLSEVQKTEQTNENEMVGRQQLTEKKLGVNTPESPNGTKGGNALNKVKSGLVTKKKVTKHLVSKECQTENGDISMVTGEEAPLEYWKQLAETRRQALEEALEENQTLHQRVEDLEKEKTILEEMVEQAKLMASMLEDLSDEENPDESGIEFSTKKEDADDSVLEKE